MNERLFLLQMERLICTPKELAAIFGREKTWTYRMLYAGKISAVTEYGRTMIPRSEADKIVTGAGRYLAR